MTPNNLTEQYSLLMDIQPGQHGVLQMLELVTISWDCDVVVLVDNGYQDMLVKSHCLMCSIGFWQVYETYAQWAYQRT